MEFDLKRSEGVELSSRAIFVPCISNMTVSFRSLVKQKNFRPINCCLPTSYVTRAFIGVVPARPDFT